MTLWPGAWPGVGFVGEIVSGWAAHSVELPEVVEDCGPVFPVISSCWVLFSVYI